MKSSFITTLAFANRYNPQRAMAPIVTDSVVAPVTDIVTAPVTAPVATPKKRGRKPGSTKKVLAGNDNTCITILQKNIVIDFN